LVVHAYRGGAAPGADRLASMGLEFHTFESAGTSEDIAMLMAYERGAELIVAVGTHNYLVEFMDKARRGMSSTFLTRLRVGEKLSRRTGLVISKRKLAVAVCNTCLKGSDCARLGQACEVAARDDSSGAHSDDSKHERYAGPDRRCVHAPVEGGHDHRVCNAPEHNCACHGCARVGRGPKHSNRKRQRVASHVRPQDAEPTEQHRALAL